MAIDRDFSFKSLADMDAVAKKYDRNAKIAGLLGAGTVFGLGFFQVLMVILYNKRPISTFLQTHSWQTMLGVIFLLMLLDRVEFFEREVNAVGRAYMIVREYQRGISDLDKGIKGSSVKFVKRGMERLEKVEAACSEVSEYQEMVARGRSWLRAHQEPCEQGN